MKMLNLLACLLLSGASLLTLQGCYYEAKAEKGGNLEQMQQELNWVSFAEVENLQKKDPRRVLVDVYTDWCKICKMMDQQTFSDPDLIRYLNENFHLVKFNAEEKASISFQGKTYRYLERGSRGYNELAPALLTNSMAFPSFVVLDKEFKKEGVIKGFKDASSLRMLLESDQL